VRTTVDIKPEAMAVIRKYAEDRSVSLGKAVSDLVQLGAENLPEFKTKNGWVSFDVSPDLPPVTDETLKQWEKEDSEEEYRRAISPRR
jgi:hypothetical protein